MSQRSSLRCPDGSLEIVPEGPRRHLRAECLAHLPRGTPSHLLASAAAPPAALARGGHSDVAETDPVQLQDKSPVVSHRVPMHWAWLRESWTHVIARHSSKHERNNAEKHLQIFTLFHGPARADPSRPAEESPLSPCPLRSRRGHLGLNSPTLTCSSVSF